MRRSFGLIFVLLSVSFLAWAGPKEDAVQKRKEAEKLSTQGEYSKALTAYEEAETLFPDPLHALGRAQVLMKLRRFTEANEAYQKFLASGKAGKKQKEIQQAIEDLSVILQTEISCASTPEGATVYLNSTVDAPLGVTPFVQNVPPGTHRLIFQKDGFDTLSQVITVEAKTSQKIQVSLPDKPALLSISATPSSAEIMINGEAKGKTPIELKLADGAYIVEASAIGFATQKKKFEVKAKQNYSWSIDLTQPPPGLLSVSIQPKNATVTINDKVISNNTKTSLPPGKYQATISAPQHASQQQEVVIQSEQENTLSVALKAEGITFQVKANRPSMVLLVNGVVQPIDSLGVAILPAGEQTIAFESKGDSRWEQTTMLSAPTLATVEFYREPSRVPLLAQVGSGGLTATSAVFLTAGVIRLARVREACKDPVFCEENSVVLTDFAKQGRALVGVSVGVLFAAGVTLGYSLYRKRLEGETKVTFNTGQTP